MTMTVAGPIHLGHHPGAAPVELLAFAVPVGLGSYLAAAWIISVREPDQRGWHAMLAPVRREARSA